MGKVPCQSPKVFTKWVGGERGEGARRSGFYRRQWTMFVVQHVHIVQHNIGGTAGVTVPAVLRNRSRSEPLLFGRSRSRREAPAPAPP